jgi:hypothetical protein
MGHACNAHDQAEQDMDVLTFHNERLTKLTQSLQADAASAVRPHTDTQTHTDTVSARGEKYIHTRTHKRMYAHTHARTSLDIVMHIRT